MERKKGRKGSKKGVVAGEEGRRGGRRGDTERKNERGGGRWEEGVRKRMDIKVEGLRGWGEGERVCGEGCGWRVGVVGVSVGGVWWWCVREGVRNE